MTGTKMNYSKQFPAVNYEPNQSNVLSDVTLYTILKSHDKTTGNITDTRLTTAAMSSSDYTWMPDINFVQNVLPMLSDAELDGTENSTLSPMGKITQVTSDDYVGYDVLVSRCKVDHIASLRSVSVVVNIDLGVFMNGASSSAIIDTVLTTNKLNVGKVILYAANGTVICQKAWYPYVKVEFDYNWLVLAGDGCYIDAHLDFAEVKDVGATGEGQLNGSPVCNWVLDFKNDAESWFMTLLVGEGAPMVGEALVPIITNLIDHYVGINADLKQIIQRMANYGMILQDIILVIAGAYYVRWSNDKSFNIADTLTADNFIGICQTLLMLAVNNWWAFLPGIISAVAGQRLGGGSLTQILGLVGRGLTNYLFAAAILTYVTTVQVKAWI